MAKNRVSPQNVNKKNKFVQSRDKIISKDNLKQHSSNFHKFQKSNNSSETSVKQKSDNFFVKPNANGNKSMHNDKLAGPSKPQGRNTQPVKPNAKTSEPVKKPFDKKNWRIKKYSKKYKLQQWEDSRKRAVLKEYYKSIKDEDQNFDVKKIYELSEDEENDHLDFNKKEVNSGKSEEEEVIPANSKFKKRKAYKSVQDEFQRIRDEKQKAKEEAIRKKTERAEAIEEYKKNKTERQKKLNRKTRKGQPIMKDRIEMMLESIQKSIADDS